MEEGAARGWDRCSYQPTNQCTHAQKKLSVFCDVARSRARVDVKSICSALPLGYSTQLGFNGEILASVFSGCGVVWRHGAGADVRCHVVVELFTVRSKHARTHAHTPTAQTVAVSPKAIASASIRFHWGIVLSVVPVERYLCNTEYR